MQNLPLSELHPWKAPELCGKYISCMLNHPGLMVPTKPLRRSLRGITSSLLGCAMLCLTAAGCGANKAVIHQAAPRVVRVSLIQLAKQSPAWISVVQLDGAAQGALHTPEAVAFPSLPTADDSAEDGGRGKGVETGSHDLRSVARRTQAALSLAQAKALGHIQDRLIRESRELANRFAAAQQAQVAAGVELARQQAIGNYNAALQSLLTPVAAQRINLNVQIAALTINARPGNPPTAPDGYWSGLLAQRKAALDKLPLPQTIAQRAALDQIGGQVATAKAALEQAAEAQIAAYRSSLTARNRQVLLRQSTGFFHEQSDLISVADQLDNRIDRTIGSEIADTRSPRSQPGAGPTSAGHAFSSSQLAAQAAEPQPGNAFLAAQRTRLIVQLLDATRSGAVHAAAQLNYKIVDWNASRPDAGATALLVSRMRENSAQGA